MNDAGLVFGLFMVVMWGSIVLSDVFTWLCGEWPWVNSCVAWEWLSSWLG